MWIHRVKLFQLAEKRTCHLINLAWNLIRISAEKRQCSNYHTVPFALPTLQKVSLYDTGNQYRLMITLFKLCNPFGFSDKTSIITCQQINLNTHKEMNTITDNLQTRSIYWKHLVTKNMQWKFFCSMFYNFTGTILTTKWLTNCNWYVLKFSCFGLCSITIY